MAGSLTLRDYNLWDYLPLPQDEAITTQTGEVNISLTRQNSFEEGKHCFMTDYLEEKKWYPFLWVFHLPIMPHKHLFLIHFNFS